MAKASELRPDTRWGYFKGHPDKAGWYDAKRLEQAIRNPVTIVSSSHAIHDIATRVRFSDEIKPSSTRGYLGRMFKETARLAGYYQKWGAAENAPVEGLYVIEDGKNLWPVPRLRARLHEIEDEQRATQKVEAEKTVREDALRDETVRATSLLDVTVREIPGVTARLERGEFVLRIRDREAFRAFARILVDSEAGNGNLGSVHVEATRRIAACGGPEAAMLEIAEEITREEWGSFGPNWLHAVAHQIQTRIFTR